MKVGIGIADVMCGMYASSAILAALRHRDQSGEGQYIDIALVDTQIAWLINEGANYLTSKKLPTRRGNQHPNIVPYQVFEVNDGHIIVAVGNDTQFARFCALLDCEELAQDEAYSTNIRRIENRDVLIGMLEKKVLKFSKDQLLQAMKKHGVPAGPINNLEEVFNSEQVAAREMKITMAHPQAGSGEVELIGNPIKFSKTPVTYRRAPPVCGADTNEVLADWLDK